MKPAQTFSKISGIESERHLDSIINERNSGPASFETYSSPPPFESSTHLRYGLHVWNGKDSIHSQLSVFDASGRKLDQKSLPHLLCEGEKVDFWKPRSCGCQLKTYPKGSMPYLQTAEFGAAISMEAGRRNGSLSFEPMIFPRKGQHLSPGMP